MDLGPIDLFLSHTIPFREAWVLLEGIARRKGVSSAELQSVGLQGTWDAIDMSGAACRAQIRSAGDWALLSAPIQVGPDPRVYGPAAPCWPVFPRPDKCDRHKVCPGGVLPSTVAQH